MKIQIVYNDGIDSAKDKVALSIAEKYGAKFIGSGCWLFAPFERDLEWEVPAVAFSNMAAELRKSGFEVRNAQ